METKNRQITDWGYIDWLETAAKGKSPTLNVGIVSISPRAHMNPHIHFTEQVIYTMQGQGYSLINGKKLDMSKPNQIYHWEASVIHEMYNEGDEEFKHLMVSCPDAVSFESLLPQEAPAKLLSPEEGEEYLQLAIRGTCEQLLDTLHYSYVIFNARGVPVKQTAVFPAFCCRHCEETLAAHTAGCMNQLIPFPFTEEGHFECPYGLTVFYVPILFRGTFLGYIQGGYAHTHTVASEEEIYVMPESSIEGIRVLLRRIATAMVQYCEFYQFKNQLLEQEMALADTRHYQEVLVSNLRNAENTVLDLRINNHFLFNTLNQMASMALGGGVLPLYQSILDLSNLFSYAIRNSSTATPLSKEFAYLDSYLKLQKLRYQNHLQIDYQLKTELSQWEVPFNFLMPLVENAFTHGFSQEDEKYLGIAISEDKDSLLFVIRNNGAAVSPGDCQRIQAEMKRSTAHGLSMAYQKLHTAFGENFSLELFPETPGGLKLVLRLPAVKIPGEEEAL